MVGDMSTTTEAISTNQNDSTSNNPTKLETEQPTDIYEEVQ